MRAHGKESRAFHRRPMLAAPMRARFRDTSSWRGSSWLAGLRPFAMALAFLSFVQCDSDGCEPGERCSCSGGEACYLGCDGDGCHQACSSLTSCGAVCGDGCTYECQRAQECSSFCGSSCTTDCHDVDACGSLCGSNCNYSCRDANRCGVRVGDGSQVRCERVSSCVVECDGRCRVTCLSVGGCNVTCSGGTAPSNCSDGVVACGAC